MGWIVRFRGVGVGVDKVVDGYDVGYYLSTGIVGGWMGVDVPGGVRLNGIGVYTPYQNQNLTQNRRQRYR
jgi:hypothetical protein